MSAAELILKKRNGEALSTKELNFFASGFLSGAIADYQMTAFLMAVCFRGMNDAEQAAWTEVMWKSGRSFTRSAGDGYWVDKHSTGGVGDKVSLLLVPLVTSVCRRSLGKGKVSIPMVSGRGLGHTGGTLDKLSSVPGFSFQLNFDEAEKLLGENGFFMMGQTDDMAPLDKRVYALRDVTATVDSIPLIVSSIMSKKLAESLNGIVFDVKVGEGGVMRDEVSARALARALVDTAKAKGLDAIAYLTAMDEPLGFAVGNRHEVEECALHLQGGPRDHALNEVTLQLAAAMVHLASHREVDLAAARKECERELESSRPYELFTQLFEAQGGDWKKFMSPKPKLTRTEILSPRDGYIAGIRARGIAGLVGRMGGARLTTEGPIDLEVGVIINKKCGSYVEKGAAIAACDHRENISEQEISRAFLDEVRWATSPNETTERSSVIRGCLS